MDYSQLSDFEINAMVHFGKSPEFKIQNGYVSFLNDEGEKTGFGRFYYKNNFPDYCNNPADAWPIIESNHIALHPLKSKGIWVALSHDHEYSNRDVNPLRAAMVTFLTWKGSFNA